MSIANAAPTGTTTPTATTPPVAAPTTTTAIPVTTTMPQRPTTMADPVPSLSQAPTEPVTPPVTTEPKPGETSPATTTEPPTGDFQLPEEYKDKPWAAKVKSLDDLYKQIDTLDALKGKKSIPPDLAKATPEEREAFYAQLRPASPDEYVFPETPLPMPDGMKSAVTDMFMKNGISAVQANEIIKSYNELGRQQTEAMFDPKGFESELEKAFGPDWKGITGNVRNSLKGIMSPEDNTMLDNLPNAYLAVMYRTLGNVVQKYGVKETDQAHFNAPGTAAPTDVNAQRAELRTQMQAMSGRPHTETELNALRQKLADTYKNDPRLQQQG